MTSQKGEMSLNPTRYAQTIPTIRPMMAIAPPAALLFPEPKYAAKMPATSMTRANANTTRVRKDMIVISIFSLRF